MDESNCGTREEVYTHLEMDVGEKVMFEGLNGDGQLLQIFLGAENEGWSLVLTDPSVGKAVESCIIDGGDYWSFISNPSEDTLKVEPQTAADNFDQMGALKYSELPSLLAHYQEAAHWKGEGGASDYILSTDGYENFTVFMPAGTENAYPHSEQMITVFDFGQTLNVTRDHGTGIQTMSP